MLSDSVIQSLLEGGSAVTGHELAAIVEAEQVTIQRDRAKAAVEQPVFGPDVLPESQDVAADENTSADEDR